LDGLPLVAHVAAHPLALVDAAGREAAADRATVAEELVGSVGVARAAELVALEHALVALALGAADDVDGAALLEDLGGLEHLADLVLRDLLGGEADLADDARRLEVRLGVGGELRLGDQARLPLLETDLDRAVLVALRRPLREDHAGAGRDGGDRDPVAVGAE